MLVNNLFSSDKVSQLYKFTFNTSMLISFYISGSKLLSLAPQSFRLLCERFLLTCRTSLIHWKTLWWEIWNHGHFKSSIYQTAGGEDGRRWKIHTFLNQRTSALINYPLVLAFTLRMTILTIFHERISFFSTSFVLTLTSSNFHNLFVLFLASSV